VTLPDAPPRRALVTGASAGIGAALAEIFAREGYALVLVARRRERLDALKVKLQSLHNAEVSVISADLSDPGAPDAIAGSLAREDLPVDVLVNNAGYNQRGTVPDVPWPAKRKMLETMAVAPYALTHHLLPSMRAKGAGGVLNVASVVGLMPGGVGNTLYSGVKAMQVSFSEALHVDELKHGIHVTALCPGLTWSEFHDVDGSRESLARVPKFLWHTSESVAEAGYRALMRNNVVCVPGLFYKAAVVAGRILPRALSNRIAAKYSRGVR
jgi:short-subunit dehydrogenase